MTHKTPARPVADLCHLPPDAWMTRFEAAMYLNTTPAALAIRASVGSGPEHGQYGRFVRYQKGALDQWLKSATTPDPQTQSAA